MSGSVRLANSSVAIIYQLEKLSVVRKYYFLVTECVRFIPFSFHELKLEKIIWYV